MNLALSKTPNYYNYDINHFILENVSYIAKGPKYYRHIYDVKSSRLEHDLPILVNDRVISPFREGYIFTKLHIQKFSREFYFRE